MGSNQSREKVTDKWQIRDNLLSLDTTRCSNNNSWLRGFNSLCALGGCKSPKNNDVDSSNVRASKHSYDSFRNHRHYFRQYEDSIKILSKDTYCKPTLYHRP
jgi:hypothetical protein